MLQVPCGRAIRVLLSCLQLKALKGLFQKKVQVGLPLRSGQLKDRDRRSVFNMAIFVYLPKNIISTSFYGGYK